MDQTDEFAASLLIVRQPARPAHIPLLTKNKSHLS